MCLVAFRKENWGPIEAGFKYMVMGAVGSTLLLMGIALIYGMAGTVNFAQISTALRGQPMSLWLYLVFAILVVGFGIKSAIVPMHTWLPDAHPEAPSPISAMLSGILIETALYGFIRILYLTLRARHFYLTYRRSRCRDDVFRERACVTSAGSEENACLLQYRSGRLHANWLVQRCSLMGFKACYFTFLTTPDEGPRLLMRGLTNPQCRIVEKLIT